MTARSKVQVNTIVSGDPTCRVLKLNLLPELFKIKGFYKKMDFLFWKVLCPYPDQTKIGMWWYGVSGRIASYFHRKHCRQCKSN